MAIITTTQASELIPNFDPADAKVLTDIVNAASALVEKWCNRTFAITSYDELLDGTGHPNILLSNYPLVSIDRIMFQPMQVISIGNTKASVSRASYRLDATSLYLTTMDAGSPVNRTIARSACLTIADLATAINGYSGDGWTALALGNFATYATADLFSPQGGAEIRWVGRGYLWHHAYGIGYLQQNPAIGEVVSSLGFQRGYQNYRAIYTAGFATIPLEVQQATAELAAAVYNARETNPNLASENLGSYSYANIAEKSFANLSIASRYSLFQYKNTRIAKYKTM